MKKLTNWQLVLLGFCAGILLSGIGFWQWERAFSNPEIISLKESSLLNNSLNPKSGETTSNADEIVIHLAGAVLKPGLLKVTKKTRLGEALEMAGGGLKEADLDRLNLAICLEDGCRYYIPTYAEREEESGGLKEISDGKIDINEAGLVELMTLPQIGETRAKAILAYREKQGRFFSIEDIMKVNGIGEGIFSAIKDEIKVK